MEAGSKVSSLSIKVKFSPTVVRISQGLVHTSSLAAHVWVNSLRSWEVTQEDVCGSNKTCDGNAVDAAFLLLNHYILCNDSLDDLQVGQVG